MLQMTQRLRSTSRRNLYRGLYCFAEMTSVVPSKASLESSASQSGSFVHFWRDASTIRCPNSHLVFVVVVVSGWRFSDSWRFSGSWRFRLFGVVSSIDYLRQSYGASQEEKALDPVAQSTFAPFSVPCTFTDQLAKSTLTTIGFTKVLTCIPNTL